MRANYFFRLLIWLSCGFNTLTGGSPFMTFSATQHAREIEGKRNFAVWVDLLFFWEEAHCEQSWYRHQERLREWRTQ